MEDSHIARRNLSEPPGQCAGGSYHAFSLLAQGMSGLEVRARGAVGPASVPCRVHTCGDGPASPSRCVLWIQRWKSHAWVKSADRHTGLVTLQTPSMGRDKRPESWQRNVIDVVPLKIIPAEGQTTCSFPDVQRLTSAVS